jgi:hypothetical protein
MKTASRNEHEDQVDHSSTGEEREHERRGSGDREIDQDDFGDGLRAPIYRRGPPGVA